MLHCVYASSGEKKPIKKQTKKEVIKEPDAKCIYLFIRSALLRTLRFVAPLCRSAFLRPRGDEEPIRGGKKENKKLIGHGGGASVNQQAT